MRILIPCKDLTAGKSRLAQCLDADGRRALCEQLLIRTVELAATLVAPDFVRVVTGDRDAAAIAARYKIAALADPGGGLNVALSSARTALLRDGVDDGGGLLTIPIDLPFATPDVIMKAVASAGDLVIASDESGTGTNLLLMRAAALRCVPFAFGPDSYAAHVAAAQANGLTVATVNDRRIAFDIDGPAQYAAWRARFHPAVC